MAKLFDLPFGYVGTYDDNELEIVSTKSDPPKLRFAVDADKVESNLGAPSFNIRRSDGRHEEYALVMGRLTADKQGGALYVAVRPPGQSAVQEVAYFDSGQAIFHVPVIAPNLGGGAAATGRLVSGSGRLVYQLQEDPASGPIGRIIVYDTHFSSDEAAWTPVGHLSPVEL